MSKKTLSRKETKIKQIEKSSNKQVTFSKRSIGIFKKAGALSVLCDDAQMAVIVYQKGLSFVVGATNKAHDVLVAKYNKVCMKKHKEEEKLRKKMAETKVKADEKKKMMEMGMSEDQGFWWDEPVDLVMMEEQEKQEYMMALETLRNKVADKPHKIMNETVARTSIPVVHQHPL